MYRHRVCAHWFAVAWMVATTTQHHRLWADPPDPSRLQMDTWADASHVHDPVALAFDHRGGLYVVETARRGTVDIDVRAHRTWLLDDLASDDFDSMRAFFRRSMAPELSAENQTWLLDRNGDGVHDFRDLTTISERIRFIEDRDGDGTADHSTIYAEGFQEEFTGVAAGVLPYDGDIFFTVYPDLWKLRDLDGDSKADGRVSLFRGFGVHAAFDGHDLHGLTVGPEGKIYFSCGDNGFSVVTREGKRLHHPNTGGVLRMNPDGSELEVFAIGLRNVQEFDFDQFGNMFGVDNDGDLEDERERAVYIAEGSDSGWRVNWQFRSPGWSEVNGGLRYNPWTAEGMWKPQHSQQPTYITPPMQNYSVGPGGFKFNPGTAINDDYRNFFFCVQFPVQKVTAFRTRPHGAGFEMVDEHLFHGGLMVSSINFGPDGAIYLADWRGMWQPNGDGMIHRVDDPDQRDSARRREVQRLLRDGVEGKPVPQLVRLLGHADRRVRQLAQTELARRGRTSNFLQVATDTSAKTLARLHALWGLIQVRQEVETLQLADHLPWSDANDHIRQQCARVAGDLRLVHAANYLQALLKDPVPLVRSHAAIALGKLGDSSSVDGLVEMLRINADLDPFLRHAAVMGLAGSATAETLMALSAHESASVRMGAVLALRKQQSPLLAHFLNDKQLAIVRESARGIHDDFSIPPALPDLARVLSDDSLPADEPTLRRIVSANFRLGDTESAERIALFLLRAPSVDPQLHAVLWLEGIDCLADWENYPVVDRVEGSIRREPRTAPHAGRETLTKYLDQFMAVAPADAMGPLLDMITKLGLTPNLQQMESWAESSTEPLATRLVSLRVLEKHKVANLDKLAMALWLDAEEPMRRAAFEVMVRRDKHQAWKLADWSKLDTSQQQWMISLLPQFNSPEADARLQALVAALPTSSSSDTDADTSTAVNESQVLDIVTAARQRPIDPLRNMLETWTKQVDEHSWGEYQFARLGGDAARGELIYRTHVTAQCVRCHDAGGENQQAGPVLKGIANRVDSKYLLEAIIDPSATIAKGFAGVSMVMNDGRVVSGTVVREDDEHLVLGTPDGNSLEIQKADIELRQASDQSAMPNMRQVLSPIEVRDVVAYLSTLR